MSALTDRSLRIGEVAQLTGTTTRTIRYYEEIGLLPGAVDRVQGQHRCYSQADVDRVKEIVRLRDLLGLSLEQLSKLLEAETARAELRREYHATEDAPTRRRILEEALTHIASQLELVSARRRELQQLERELTEKRDDVKTRIAELGR
jgi:DNA-binding transcriptional MerR regulator